MNLPVLYSFRRCPYAMRARMALVASRFACEVREIKLSAKPQAMLAASPKGTVPVLILPDGRVLEESLEIMGYALSLADPFDWLAEGAVDDPLIATNDGAFKHHLDRYKYPSRYPDDPIDHRAEGLGILQGLNAILQACAFLKGPRASVVDVALFPFIRQFAAVEPQWFAAQDMPALQNWLAHWVGSDLFSCAMRHYDLWSDGAAPIPLVLDPI